MKRHLLNLLILCISCTNINAQNTPVTLQLKWWHQFQFAGYYAANIKGFYKQQGLDVQIIQGDKDHPPVKQVLDNKADFGVTGSDLIVNFANGQPVTAIGAIFQHSPYCFISRKDKKIFSPTDLVGKNIMASEDQGWVQLKAMLIKEGIPSSSINIIAHSWNNNDLIDGRADAMTGYVSVEPYQLIKKGVEVNYIQPINYGIDFYGDIIFCNQQLAKENPELVNRFRRASFDGWIYAMKHIDEMTNYILTLPGVKERGATKEMLLYEAETMKKLILPDLVEVGHMNEGRWQHILDIHKALRLVPGNTQLNGFIFNPQRDNSKVIKWVILGLVIAFCTLVLFLAYSLSLKKAVRKRTFELLNEIRERKRTEEQLRVSEERLEMAIDAAGLGIWDWDLNNNNVFFSNELKAMLGYAPTEMGNTIQSFMYLLHPDHNKEINQKLNDHIYNKRDKYDAIVRLKMKDGNWKWILIISKALSRDENGVATRLTGIHIDIDQIKKKEIELKHLTDELTHSNEDLRQFAYITSHNLRAPVANMMGLMMFIEKEGLNENNASLIDKMEFCVNKLNQTLSDLNEVLTARNDKSIHLEELEFEQEVNETLASISEEVNNSQAIITSNYEVPSIHYSKRTLDSILINLVTNAIKYRKKEMPPNIYIHTYEADGQTVLAVKDNGIGINMERNQNKLFGLYQRFNTDVHGKGMGLFLIKNQIEALHGSISVASTLNEGSTFIVRFNNVQ